ncbi:MAG: HAD family hydrolase [Brevinema sp.]
MFKALLFDMDGTILDTEYLYYHSFKNNLQQHGYSLDKSKFMAQMGLGELDGATIMVESYFPDLSPEEYIKIIDIKGLRKQFKENTCDIPIMLGFNEIVKHYQGKLFYAIATGSPLDTLETMKQRFSFEKYFQIFVSRDEVPYGKPAPDIYLEAAKRLDVAIDTCIVLEDAPAGVEAGIASGAYTIAIKNEWTAHFDFPKAHFICNSLLEAQDHIDTLL